MTEQQLIHTFLEIWHELTGITIMPTPNVSFAEQVEFVRSTPLRLGFSKDERCRQRERDELVVEALQRLERIHAQRS